ncbi:unnamed protein product [Ambrosiozyma monospora]|uniref:Unnamed protein product n=1 Tax=Ambrosiozyma monospora TaxID=43982 RepID=A0ACB5TZ86_AMBMO|nr:unnamed protein product [Ambrosiozyma monospora]
MFCCLRGTAIKTSSRWYITAAASCFKTREKRLLHSLITKSSTISLISSLDPSYSHLQSLSIRNYSTEQTSKKTSNPKKLRKPKAGPPQPILLFEADQKFINPSGILVRQNWLDASFETTITYEVVSNTIRQSWDVLGQGVDSEVKLKEWVKDFAEFKHEFLKQGEDGDNEKEKGKDFRVEEVTERNILRCVDGWKAKHRIVSFVDEEDDSSHRPKNKETANKKKTSVFNFSGGVSDDDLNKVQTPHIPDETTQEPKKKRGPKTKVKTRT